jgi:CDP-diacylglycerol--serine O-phosphatidyltransferase
VPKPLVLPLLLGAAGYAALLVAEPWAALAAGGSVYASLLPASLRSYQRLARDAAADAARGAGRA